MQNSVLSKYRGITGQKNSFTLFVLKRVKTQARTRLGPDTERRFMPGMRNYSFAGTRWDTDISGTHVDTYKDTFAATER
jgi:hypothetical protein